MSEVNDIMSLKELCVYYCINRLEILMTAIKYDDTSRRHNILPQNLCDFLLDTHMKTSTEINPTLISLLSDITHLSRVVVTPLGRGDFDPEFLKDLSQHPLNTLEMSCCTDDKNFSFENTFSSLQNLQTSLRVLKLHLNSACYHCEELTQNWMQNCVICSKKEKTVNEVLTFPNLSYLSLKNFCFKSVEIEDDGYVLKETEIEDFFVKTFRPLSRLTVLDLYGSKLYISCLSVLAELSNLSKLCLANVKFGMDIEEALKHIVKAKKLRYLDLSSSLDEEELRHDDHQEFLLHYIVSELPCLVSLDVSHRNLADSLLRPVATKTAPDRADTRFPALCDRQFEFLGLWGCNTDQNLYFPVDLLPVTQVTGDDTDDQLLLSVHVYKTNPAIAENVFRTLLHKLSNEEFTKSRAVIGDILEYLQLYRCNTAIACLYYALASIKHQVLEQAIRTKVLETAISLVNRVHTLNSGSYMVKVCLLVFILLDIPHDALCCYMFDRFLSCLIYILRNYEGHFHQKRALLLLHEVCRGNEREKEESVQAGAMEILYDIIEKKLSFDLADDILERAWSCLWSVTDMMPSNCKRFLTSERAVELFFLCVEKFGTKTGLIRKMTGVMANVSEVEDLRPVLMNDRFLSYFSQLLSEESIHDIDVCYHAVGVLSELLVDGSNAWTVENPSRQEISDKIAAVVLSWNVDTPRKIKYRSLSPLIRISQISSVPEAQLWAVWAICNLVTVKADRYCPMLKYDGGVTVIEDIIKDPKSRADVCELANMIMTKYNSFKFTESSASFSDLL